MTKHKSHYFESLMMAALMVCGWPFTILSLVRILGQPCECEVLYEVAADGHLARRGPRLGKGGRCPDCGRFPLLLNPQD